MIENIKDIPQSSGGNLTESELQTVVACKWLNLGIPSMAGGEKLSKWLEGHIDGIENVFGADDRVYIKCKDPKTNKALAEFVIKEQVGDEVQWRKCKDSDRWWLYIWWD